MIQVYVRATEDVEGQLLGEFSLQDLPRLVETFKKYPTYIGNTTEDRIGKGIAQFVLDSSGAFFEIIVEKE